MNESFDHNYLKLSYHSFDAFIAFCLMKFGNNGCKTIPIQLFTGMNMSFCPFDREFTIIYAQTEADSLLFFDYFEACFLPITSFNLMGVSILDGYTIVIDIFSYYVLRL